MDDPTRITGPSVSAVIAASASSAPVADTPLGEFTAACPVAGIVEPQEGTARPPRPGLQMHGLGAGHVRAQATQEHHARLTPGKAVIGEPAALRGFKKFGVVHRVSLVSPVPCPVVAAQTIPGPAGRQFDAHGSGSSIPGAPGYRPREHPDGLDAVCLPRHSGRVSYIPATGRSVGAKPTRRLADEPNFPDLPRWREPILRGRHHPCRGRRRHLSLAREKRPSAPP